MSAMLIVKPGLQTTVQDLGRWGHQASGVPVAGAMDLSAHRRANALVGNAAGAATLEITLVGPQIECDRDAFMAVCGAEFDLAVDGEPVRPGADIYLKAGQRLAFGDRRAGARAYLAIAGGFAVEEVFGSRSTHVPSAMGGFQGRALRAGDRLPIGTAPEHSKHVVRGVPGRAKALLHEDKALNHEDEALHHEDGALHHDGVLRVLPAPDLERFEEDAFDALMSAPYLVRNESNRMGYRLRGPTLALRRPESKISDATPIGLIQVPPSGEPILLMADRPTTGGYPGIANVISADIDLAAQLAPGDTVRFVPCSLADALDGLHERERGLSAIEVSTRG